MSSDSFKFEYEKKPLPNMIIKLGSIFLGIGFILVLLSMFNDPIRASFVSLVTFAFVLSIGLGSMFIIALEYIAGAVWSVPFRRIAESLGALVFVAPIFLIPVIFNLHSLYHWTHKEAVLADAALSSKAPFLNETFFYIRLVVIFVLWWMFYIFITRNSKKQDIDGDPKHSKRNTVLSGIFILVLAITITLTSIDWLMSLEPHWFSTIFGVYYFAGTVIAGLAAMTLFSINLNETGFLVKGLRRDHYYSFGALMFAFVNFWAYIAFSQFMLIWYANLPEETFWFITRGAGSWMYFSIGMILVHFLIPYILILPQPAKMDPKRLKMAGAWLLFAHFYDMYWLVMPSLDKNGMSFSFFDLSFPIFAIGLVMVVFYLVAKNKNLLPIKDPKLKRALEFRL
jgi:hypothetical protein